MPRYQQLDEAKLDAEQRRIFNDCKAGPARLGAAAGACLAEEPRPRRPRPQARRACAVRHAVHPKADRDRDPVHGALLDGAVRMGRACAPGPEGRPDAGRDRRDRRAPHPAISPTPTTRSSTISAHDYYQDHRVDDATYDRVVERWGDKGIVDLAGLIGYYSFVSVTLNVFEVPTPAGRQTAGEVGQAADTLTRPSGTLSRKRANGRGRREGRPGRPHTFSTFHIRIRGRLDAALDVLAIGGLLHQHAGRDVGHDLESALLDLDRQLLAARRCRWP